MSRLKCDQEVQTLRPIPYNDVLSYLNIDCWECKRLWIPSSTEIVLYRIDEEKSMCFHCANEVDQERFLRRTQELVYTNPKAWMQVEVSIHKFSCCNCGNSCDNNYRVSDGFVGKIPFVTFVGDKRHRFCILCFEIVKNDLRKLNPLNCVHG